MSSAKQILALLRSRAEGDDDAFFAVALQAAAAEARQGHRSIAEDIRAAVDQARVRRPKGASVAVQFGAPRGNLEGLLELRPARVKLRNVFLNDSVKQRMADVVRQQQRRDWLREHGKTPSRRLLFIGPPGSGKTMSAEAFAGELDLPFYVIRLEGLITRYMGETAAKLRLIFDETAKKRGVYLFDEFDAVGGHRTATNDVAEMRRVLNSFLQFMEEENATDSLVICATNHPSLLDRALLRRYDSVVEFAPPSAEQVEAIVKANLGRMGKSRLAWKSIAAAAAGLSQSEIVRAVDDAVKAAILDERAKISTDELVARLNDRSAMRSAFREAMSP